jgi:hypothetical protein
MHLTGTTQSMTDSFYKNVTQAGTQKATLQYTSSLDKKVYRFIFTTLHQKLGITPHSLNTIQP